GQTLRSLFKSGPLPIPEALRIGCDIARGLAEAHRAGIIHRDLKPDNIMIGPGQSTKIVDFGVARLLLTEEKPPSPPGQTGISTVLTGEGVLLGTVTYMSPEQARGDVADARSDIFSFGIVLYELLTGSPPFRGATRSDILSSIIKDGFVPAGKL